MKNTLFISSLFVAVCNLMSCRSESQLEVYFTDDSKKWVYVDGEKTDSAAAQFAYIKFSKDHKCQNFKIADDKRLSAPGSWEYSPNDSSLVVLDHTFKVLKVDKDTMVVKHDDKNFKVLFVNVSGDKANN